MGEERPVIFGLKGDALLGIVHLPSAPAESGVLIVVGGPQYRVGAHRQFVHLARGLADHGIAAMRFDYRGIGDSEGRFAGFEGISEDIDAALAAFREQVAGLRRVIVWGLCDAASAIMMKGDYDPLTAGAVIVNPWVRTQAGEAKAYLKHYYLGRLLSGGFWRKLLAGRLYLARSLRDITVAARTSRTGGGEPLPQLVINGIRSAPFPVLVILSGNDLVAREFEGAGGGAVANTSPQAPVAIKRLPRADHTFSSMAWKDEVLRLTVAWIQSIAEPRRSRPE